MTLPDTDTVQFWPSVVPTCTPVSEVKPVSVATKQRVASESSPVMAPSASVKVRAKVLVELVRTEVGPTKKFPLAWSVKVVWATKPEVCPVAVRVYATPGRAYQDHTWYWRKCHSRRQWQTVCVPSASALHAAPSPPFRLSANPCPRWSRCRPADNRSCP